MSEIRVRVAENLRKLMDARGMNAAFVADSIGAARSGIYDLLAMRRSITLDRLDELATVIVVEPSRLLEEQPRAAPAVFAPRSSRELLARSLRRWLTVPGRSVQWLSGASGVAPSMVYRLLRQTTNSSIECLPRLALAMDLTAGQLLAPPTGV